MRKYLLGALLLIAHIAMAQSPIFSIPHTDFTQHLLQHSAKFQLRNAPSLFSAITWEERPNSYAASTGIRTFVGRLDGQLVGSFSYDQQGRISGAVHLDTTYDIVQQGGNVVFRPSANPTLECGAERKPELFQSLPTSVPAQPFSVRDIRSSSDNFKITDGNYRIFRLAILVSQTDLDSPRFENDLNKVRAYLAECEAYLNELYVKELGIQFVLVKNDKLLRSGLTSFQVSEDNGTQKLNEIIGEDAYDVGIIMAFNGRPDGKSGAPNRALLGGCQWPYRKGGVCVRDQNLVAFAHELGHHFGARHTFPGGDGVGSETDPGQSAMGYNGRADFFGKFSLLEMMPNIKRMDVRMDATGLPYKYPTTTNRPPEFDASLMKSEYRIPKNSFFVLTLHASDPDGDAIYFGRQQEGYSVAFPTSVPSTNNRLSFGREYRGNLMTLAGSDRNDVGNYDFSFYAYDAVPHQQAVAEHRAPLYDVWRTKINIVDGTPFKFTSHLANSYTAGIPLKLTWGVDKNFFPDAKKSKVRILMSDDAGKTFNHVLVPSTDNDGECEVFLPQQAMPVIASHGVYYDKWDNAQQKYIKNGGFRGIWFTGSGMLRIETIDDELHFFDNSNGQRNTTKEDPLRGGIELKACPVTFQGLPTTYIKLSSGEAIPAAPRVTAKAQNKSLAVDFSEKTEDNMLIRTWKVVYNGQTYGAQQYIERAEGDSSPITPTPTPTPTPEPPQPQPKPELPKEIKVSKITLSSLTPTVTIGDEVMISATISPNNASNAQLKWTVSPQNALQTTNTEGNFIAQSVGDVTIHVEATDGSGVSADYQVKIQPKKVQKISLDAAKKELYPNDSFTLKATISPDNATNKAVKWEVVAGSDVVSIAQDGTITAKTVGEATVRATSTDGSNVFAECKVVVNARPVASITLNASEKTLLPQESFQLTATITPDNATNKAVKWEVTQGSDVVSIAQDGTITAKTVGTATVRAISTDGSSVFTECKVVVNARPVASITLNAPTTPIFIGDTFKLSANVLPTNATNANLVWKMSNKSVLQSLGNGQFKAKRVGKTRIIAEAADGSGVNAEVEINILPLLIQTITLDKAEYAPTVGDRFELTAEITPENATNRELHWWVSDQNVLENLGNGAFRALKVGNALVEVRTTDGSQRKASCKITVVYPDGIAAAGTNYGTPQVTIDGNTLEISGISAQTWVEILNLHGQPLHRAQSKGDVLRIVLHEMPQVLIAKVGHRSYKVVTKM